MGKGTTITTHADVYMQEIPSTSNSVMMSSGDSPTPAQASISSPGFDVLDDARLVKSTSTTSAKPSKPTETDNEAITEAIEEATPIVQTTLPTPEPKPMIERNGLDVDTKKPSNQNEDDSCLIDCIYYTQQCCECTIL